MTGCKQPIIVEGSWDLIPCRHASSPPQVLGAPHARPAQEALSRLPLLQLDVSMAAPGVADKNAAGDGGKDMAEGLVLHVQLRQLGGSRGPSR